MMDWKDDDEISLPEQYRNIPLTALRVTVRTRLSLFLNTERLPNEHGVVPDFNGLAEKIGFTYLEIQNFGRQNVRNPTREVLDEWTQRPDLEPTVGKLYIYLQELGRIDILTDTKDCILTDIELHIKQEECRKKNSRPVQDHAISSVMEIDECTADEGAIMTVQDVEKGSAQYYDAFVCYHPEGADLHFLKMMLEELESPKYSLKFLVPLRDDLPGGSDSTISAKLIKNRCRRMVIILSPQYLRSPICDFQTKYAQSLSPGSRFKRLIPVLFQPCKIPEIISHVTRCDYTKEDLREWFWNRLARAISAPLQFTESESSSSSSSMEDITSSLKDYKPLIPPFSSSSSSFSSTNSNSGSSITLPPIIPNESTLPGNPRNLRVPVESDDCSLEYSSMSSSTRTSSITNATSMTSATSMSNATSMPSSKTISTGSSKSSSPASSRRKGIPFIQKLFSSNKS